MNILLKKARHQDKNDTLTCVRDDGSATWMAESAHFIQHDIIHYVVETTFGLNNAFYGQVADGWDIQAFGKSDPETGKKPEIPMAAAQVEFIVGLLQVELSDGQINEDFLATLEASCKNASSQVPQNITDERLNDVRTKTNELLKKWNELPPGETLELIFNE